MRNIWMEQDEDAIRIRNRDPRGGPVHWCAACFDEPVVFDWRKEIQLCRRCEAAEARAA